MTTKQWMGAAVVAAVVQFAAPAGIAQAHGRGGEAAPDVVLEWNQILISTIPAAVGPLQFRHFAMMNIAMFDAANSIRPQFTPFHTRVWASSGASMEAAAAQAAHDVLVGLVPASQAIYDAALSARLSTIAPGPARQGTSIGKAAAKQILAWRANDGASAAPVPYELPPIPGLWQPAAPGVPAGLTQLPRMTPFVLQTTTQFMPPRFPELTSERYTTDFNEVKEIGAVGSATRTPEQTQLAQLFAGIITSTNITMMWNNVARDATLSGGLSLTESARLFAMLNAAATDGLLTSQTSKFTYGLWRPVTAIRRADEDLNALTYADTTWTPLLPTPPYPSYAGNMACIGAASARVLALVMGRDDVSFTVLWRGSGSNPDVSRPYSGFWQLAQDEANSRIYGGIHYRFDNEASQAACVKVSEYAYSRVMRPLWDGRH